MIKFAIIEANAVANIVIGETALSENWVWIDADNVSVGDEYKNGEFIPDQDEQDIVVPDPIELKQIIITAVTDAIKNNSAFIHITCFELTNLTVNGNVDIPDQTFSMPLMRDDGTKRLVLFPVEVINGQFEVVLNFPTSGQYIYTDEQANHDLPNKMFTVTPIKIDVLRKTA